MTKRAVAYARVSTENQAKHGYSLPSQLEACRKYIDEKGWQTTAEISDDGVSGATLDRVGFDSIREMAQAGEIDAVVVYDLDRLSRKAVYQMLIEEEFGKAGVTVSYVLGDYRDDDEGRLQKQIRAAIAEYERAKFTERAERGKRSKARRGLVVGGGRVAYGYRYDGEGHLVIVEDEAQVVRLVFDWFANDLLSIREIARRLSVKGFRTYEGNRHWAKSTVARILANETYVGTAYYNRLGRASPYGPQKVRRPREQWIAIPVPPIIDRATWEEAQKRLEHNRKLVRRRPRHPYLLRGMLVCDECGYAYSGNYSRPTRWYRDGGRKHPDVRADTLEQAVWDALKTLLLNPATLWEGYRAREAEVGQARRGLAERLETVHKLKKKAQGKLEALTDAYLDPDIGIRKAEYAQRRRSIEKEIAERQREATDLRARIETKTVTEEQVQAVEEFTAEVREGIDLLGLEDKRKVLQLLGIRGRVRHDRDQRISVQVEGLFPETRAGVSSTTSARYGRHWRRPPVLASHVLAP